MRKCILFIMILSLGVLTAACGGQGAVSLDEPPESSSEEADSLPGVSEEEAAPEEPGPASEPQDRREPEAASQPAPDPENAADAANDGPRIQRESFYAAESADSNPLLVFLPPDGGRIDLAPDKAQELMTAIDFDRLVYTTEMFDMDTEYGFTPPPAGVMDGYVPDPAIILNGGFFKYELRLDKNSGIAMYHIEEGDQTYFYRIPEGFYDSTLQLVSNYEQYNQIPVWVFEEGEEDA